MPSNNYHFVSHWSVQGAASEVAAIIDDAPSLSDWWGSVYSNVGLIEEGDEAGVGKVFTLLGKGWLPYVLNLRFHKVDDRRANGFTVAVSGDLNGIGIWTFAQNGTAVDVTFDWTVTADKAVLRWFSPVLKPIFASNHRWTMCRGEEALRLELLRRRAQTPEESAQIPPPPAPFAIEFKWLSLGAAAALAAVVSGVLVFRRHPP